MPSVFHFSPSVWWGLAAAVPAVAAEYLYRVLPGTWIDYWWVWLPISLSVSYSVCQLVRQPGNSLLDAFVVWAFSTTFLRVVATMALGDHVREGTWVALALLVLARVAQTMWGR